MAKKIWERMRDDRLANEESRQQEVQQANQDFQNYAQNSAQATDIWSRVQDKLNFAQTQAPTNSFNYIDTKKSIQSRVNEIANMVAPRRTNIFNTMETNLMPILEQQNKEKAEELKNRNFKLKENPELPVEYTEEQKRQIVNELVKKTTQPDLGESTSNFINDSGRTIENAWIGTKHGVEDSANYMGSFFTGVQSENNRMIKRVLDSDLTDEEKRAYIYNNLNDEEANTERLNAMIENVMPAKKVPKEIYETFKTGYNEQLEKMKEQYGFNDKDAEKYADIYSKNKDKIDAIALKDEFEEMRKAEDTKIAENIENQTNIVSRKLAEISPSMGQMLPGMGLSMVNPVLGTTYFTTSAGGGYVRDAEERGMSPYEAKTYGTIMGTLEGLSESVITGQQANRILHGFGKRGISTGILNSTGFNILENVVQEAIMEPAQELTAQIVGGEDKANWDNMQERMFNAGLNGGIMGLISNGTTRGLELSGKAYQKIKNGQSLTESEVKGVIQENIKAQGQKEVENIIKQSANEKFNQIKQATMQNNEQNTQNQQTILPTQENVSNQNIETKNQLPVQNNINEQQNELKGKSFEDIVDESMANYEYEEVKSPLQNRDINTIGKDTKTNAYQYDNPEVKPYFQQMASMLGEDVGNIASADNRKTTKGGGISLNTNISAIKQLKEMGYSYNQIIDGIVNIIDDHGKENNALSKKLEIIIDDQLRNGYTNSYGKYIGPNQEYIDLINNNSSNQNVVANNQQTLYNNSNEESGINGEGKSESIKPDDQRGIEGLFPSDRRRTENDSRYKTNNERQQEIEYIKDTKNHIKKLTQAQKNIQDRYNSIGVPVNFYSYESNNGGRYDNGELYINTNNLSENEQANIAVHEYAHHLLRNNINFQNEISPIADKIIQNETTGQSEAIRDYIMQRNENISIDDLNRVHQIALEEILADYMIDIDNNIDFNKNNQYGVDINILNEYKNIAQKYLPGKQNNKINLPMKETSNEASINLPTKGEKINWNEMENPGGKIRKHYRSIIESSNTTAEAKAIAKEMMGLDTYTPQSNESLLQKADKRISMSDPDAELNSLLSRAMNNDKVSDVDIAVGERLIEYYSKLGDAEHLQDSIHATALAGTQAGRTVQALALLNHMTPQGQLVWLQRSIDKMNDALQTKYRNKSNTPQFELTQEMTDKILNTNSKEEMFEALDEVYEELGQQVPKSMSEKIDEWRYFSMLANLKTHGRNMIGNVAMHMTQRVKDKVAGVIESAVSTFKPGMERTHTIIPASKEVKQFAKNDLKNMDVQTELGMNENKYNPQSRLQGARKTFKSNVLNNTLGKLFDLNSNLLEVEDNIGLKSMYVKALSEYITANKIDVNNITDAQLSKARQHAIKSSQEATFHQASALATALNQMGKKNNIVKFALDSAVPFKKTPINVAKTGAQYSPVGLIKSAIFDTAQLRKGKITVNQYIDNISKGLTGTGIAFMGYALAEAGILKASGGDDDKKEQYDEEQGKQSYSIEIGGKTYSLDWLSPVGIPLFIGAETNQQFNQSKKEKNSKSTDDEESLNKILKSVSNLMNASANAMNPMSEMSMVQGLTSILSSYNKENAVGDMIVNTGKSYVNQFVPTLLGQVAKTTDDYERTTKSTKTGTLEKAIDSTINQIKSKIPGLRQTLPVKTDIWGQEVKQDTNLPFRAFNNFVNPATVKEVSNDVVDKELNSLYAKTKESSIIPKTIEKTFSINGTDYRMTNEEFAKYSKAYGTTSHSILESLVKSSEYKALTDEQKQKAIESVYSYAKEKNKVNYANSVAEELKTSTLYKTMQELKTSKNQSKYLDYVAQTKGIEKESTKNQILLNANYDDNVKSTIYSNGTGNDDKLYSMMKDSVDINEYLDYKLKSSNKEFSADKDSNGKTITNSAKKKIYNYVNNQISGRINKLLILANNYKLSRSEQNEILEYVKDTSNNEDEVKEKLKKLSSNFELRNDKIYYK